MKNVVIRLGLVAILFLSLVSMASSDKSSKYSKKANLPEAEKYDSAFRTLQKPFRVAKLNLLWSKAVHRLTEPKLKSLFTELKIHDKEELAYKHQKSEKPKDFNDGLKEAELRKKLIGIMSTYDLLEVMDVEVDEASNPELYKKHKPFEGKVKSDNYKNKSLFKDKKLNKLWERAELGGFSPEELQALKEEFLHHEEKVDMYFSLLEKMTDVKDNRNDDQHKNSINEDELELFNEIVDPNEVPDDIYNSQKHADKHQEYISQANVVREKHRELRDNADRLERMTARGSNESDFIEPKVQGLWRVAQAGNFTADELASIKIELHHFESRFLKLRSMHAEHALKLEKYGKPEGKHDRVDELDQKIRKQSRKVEKLQADLEKKLLRHTEL